MKKHVRTTDFDLVYVPASVTRGASQPSRTGCFSGKWDAWDGYGVTLAGNLTSWSAGAKDLDDLVRLVMCMGQQLGPKQEARRTLGILHLRGRSIDDAAQRDACPQM